MELNFQISKLDLRFQINSNGFSRDRSFGHHTTPCTIIRVSLIFEFLAGHPNYLKYNFDHWSKMHRNFFSLSPTTKDCKILMFKFIFQYQKSIVISIFSSFKNISLGSRDFSIFIFLLLLFLTYFFSSLLIILERKI